MNKYQVTWVEITPQSGVITKRDALEMNATIMFPPQRRQVFRQFHNKALAEAWILTIGAFLGKAYTCRMFTDAQFTKSGMLPDGTFKIPFTKKQLAEAVTVGPNPVAVCGDGAAE